MSEDRRRGSFIQGLVAGALATLAGVAIAVALTGEDLGEDGLPQEARHVIEDNYFEEVSGEDLDAGSVRGMVDDLDDGDNVVEVVNHVSGVTEVIDELEVRGA